MHGILEVIPQWASVMSLIACVSLFLGVIVHQLGARRQGYSETMCAMPLRDDDAVQIETLRSEKHSEITPVHIQTGVP